MPTLPPVTKALMLICAVVYCLQVLLPMLPVEEIGRASCRERVSLVV